MPAAAAEMPARQARRYMVRCRASHSPPVLQRRRSFAATFTRSYGF